MGINQPFSILCGVSRRFRANSVPQSAQIHPVSSNDAPLRVGLKVRKLVIRSARPGFGDTMLAERLERERLVTCSFCIAFEQ